MQVPCVRSLPLLAHLLRLRMNPSRVVLRAILLLEFRLFRLLISLFVAGSVWFSCWRFLCRKSVLAVARDVGVDDRLSAVDLSMLEELTGGRRAELLDVLGRLKETSSGGVSISSISAPPHPKSARTD